MHKKKQTNKEHCSTKNGTASSFTSILLYLISSPFSPMKVNLSFQRKIESDRI